MVIKDLKILKKLGAVGCLMIWPSNYPSRNPPAGFPQVDLPTLMIEQTDADKIIEAINQNETVVATFGVDTNTNMNRRTFVIVFFKE